MTYCDKIKLREVPKDLTTTVFSKDFTGPRIIAVPKGKNVKYEISNLITIEMDNLQPSL